METAKKILKIGVIAIIAIVLMVILLVGFRVATYNKNATILGLKGSFSDAGMEITPMSSVGESMDMTRSNTAKGISRESVPVSIQNSVVGEVAPVEQKIIKNGYMTAQVENADVAAQEISDIAKRLGGEVQSTNFRKGAQNMKSGSISVKVPFNNFDVAFAEIKKIATLVKSESINANDVTAQFVDLEARLRNKKAEEESFQEILNNTSGKISDVLAVTQEISRVRGEIEAMEGQMRYLSSQVEMSTITANISEDVTVGTATSWRPWQVAKTEFASMLKDMQKLVGALIVIVVRLIPVLIVLILFFLIIFWIIRAIIKSFLLRKQQRKTDQQNEKLNAVELEPVKRSSRTRTIAQVSKGRSRVVKK